MMRKLLSNHVLSWLTFLIVILLGTNTYLSLPRQQDPTINFNWIDITTLAPGLSTQDMERKVTNVLEDAIESVDDINFVQSTTGNALSSIVVRFEDIPYDDFQRRITDLRREIDSVKSRLPDAALDPNILEITTSNAFPSAMLLLTAPANDETLRYHANKVADDIERIEGVDSANLNGTEDPEIQVRFNPRLLSQYQINPTVVADTIASYYQDIAAGDISVQDQRWNVRIQGTSADPDNIARIPLLTPTGKITVDDVAEVVFTRADAKDLVSKNDQPSVLISVSKKSRSNLLAMVADINTYITEKNPDLAQHGLTLHLLDDQTAITKNALSLMENNALVGLLLVLLVSWLFLGNKVALLTSMGIPFTLAVTFIVLSSMGQTLNQSVLLGVVIALGMIVDDAVVVVESIYFRLQRGMSTIDAAIDSLREVAVPVFTAVLTTVAIFLPLMLVPGILGKFLLVIPLVVTVALFASLLEAFWMLPSHIDSLSHLPERETWVNRLRQKTLRSMRRVYGKTLVKALRLPWLTLFFSLLLMIATFGIMGLGAVGKGPLKFDFFAADTIRLFYVSIETPKGTPIEKTLERAQSVEAMVREEINADELRDAASLAGISFTEIAPLFGDQYGQVIVSLQQRQPNGRTVEAMIDAVRQQFHTIPGVVDISTIKLSGGPPAGKAISLKVLNNEPTMLRAAVEAVRANMAAIPGINNIVDNDEPGTNEVILSFDQSAVRRLGFSPTHLQREISLMNDGAAVSSLRYLGEDLTVKVLAQSQNNTDPTQWLETTIYNNQGSPALLSDLFTTETQPGTGKIQHYNFVRNVTIEADIDESITDVVMANQAIQTAWEEIADQFPGTSLDFSGQLDDIEESLNAMGGLFLFGLLLIYLILGTQFNSFFQPLLILTTVPLAFSGVVLGILVSGNPISLYTMYGVVALMGIAVNSAIVLIAAANDRRKDGMTPHHAIVYASRRRVIPILITACTTIAGLFSLAAGLAGKSLVWGPVANAIVWGLGFSTMLTLLVIPTLYLLFHRGKKHKVSH